LKVPFAKRLSNNKINRRIKQNFLPNFSFAVIYICGFFVQLFVGNLKAQKVLTRKEILFKNVSDIYWTSNQ